MTEVARLLAAAQAAHGQYREAAGRIDRHGKVSQSPDWLACGAAVKDALKARADADALDSNHHDPAWREDAHAMKGQSNATLIEFYVDYLAQAEAV